MASAAADTAGRAYGSVTLGTETFRLTHAYVQEPWLPPEPRNHAPYVAGVFVVTLTDQPFIGQIPRRFGSRFSGYPQSHGIRALTLVFDRASGQATNCLLLVGRSNNSDGVINPTPGLSYYRCIPEGGRLATTIFALRGEFLTAAVQARRARLASNTEEYGRLSISFNLAFTAPLIRAPKHVATLTGEDAATSAPARAYSDWMSLVARRDSEALAKRAERIAREQLLAAMHGMTPRASFHWPSNPAMPLAIMNSLERIYLYEDRAVLVFADDTPAYLDPRRRPQIVPMMLINGAWQLGE